MILKPGVRLFRKTAVQNVCKGEIGCFREHTSFILA